ncbi:MAG: EAL domain-containing protein [Burkholderiaceae bacterium]
MATILIVDDHAINRQFLSTLLGYGGHRLIEAAEGGQALQLVRAERPDLVITDILMPNMDGFEFVNRLRAEPPLEATPVIFYTASFRAREARTIAEACGVRWVLQKPSEPEAILGAVQQALGASLPSQPSAAAHHAPQLSASLEAARLSSIDEQLRRAVAQLDGGTVPAREGLRRVARDLSASLDSMQAVSRRLTRLVELGLDLAAERDPARMIDILCRAAHGICGATCAAVAVLDDAGAAFAHCFARGLDGDVLAALRALPPDAGLLGRLIRDRRPVRLSGLSGLPGAPGEIGLPPSHPPVSSFLGVPIATKERAYGWLYLTGKIGDDAFSEVDEQVAATIASQLASAYENLALFDETRRQRARLEIEVGERKEAQEALRRNLRGRTVMAECNHVLVHATDESDLLGDMCAAIVDTGGYPSAWIVYRDDAAAEASRGSEGSDSGSGPLRVMAHAGAAEDADWGCGGRGWDAARAAIDTGKPCLSNGARAMLSLPLLDGARVFGALTLRERETDGFDDAELALLSELADDIAYGIAHLTARRAREQAERSLLATEEKLSAILNSIDNVVWSVSDSELLYISPVAEKVFGLPVGDFYRNKDLRFEAIHPDDQARVKESNETLLTHGAVTREYRILRPDGEMRWLEERSKAVFGADGALLRYDGVISDISDRKQYQGRIEYLATHDPLTGLANRNLLRDRLAQAIALARRAGQMLALLFVDLDRFKDINDSYGHAVGDALLVEVSHRLRRVVRDCDTVARPGGDEFIILLTDFADADSVTAVAGKLLNEFALPFDVTDVELHVHASIGISLFPNDGDSIETLLRNTDTAMYRAKERGGSGYQLYSPEMSVRAMERMAIENALHRAIERNELRLFYQPKIDLKSGRVTGAEALVRWFHPELGVVLPDRFIPLAEEIGLIDSIGAWVLQEACMQNASWQHAGFAPIGVSVNLSARQFRHERLHALVAETLERTGLPAQYLELELTESAVMHSAEQFAVKLQELKALGVKLSIDDFGTGYSSLNYLKRFALDSLKIDQSFVRDIVTDADDAAITRSVISLGHSLNLRVIAEGVENSEQLAFLRSNGCDEVQGNYFSKPLGAAEFVALLQAAPPCRE